MADEIADGANFRPQSRVRSQGVEDNAFHSQIRLSSLEENGTPSDGFCTKCFGSAMRPRIAFRILDQICPRITRLTRKADRRAPERLRKIRVNSRLPRRSFARRRVIRGPSLFSSLLCEIVTASLPKENGSLICDIRNNPCDQWFTASWMTG
jgi:hypothetical protein